MDDTIKRSDVTEAFAELYDVFDDYPNIIKELDKVYDKILAILTAEKHGEWIFDDKGYFSCSECKKTPKDQSATSDFCPNCGADCRGRRTGK